MPAKTEHGEFSAFTDVVRNSKEDDYWANWNSFQRDIVPWISRIFGRQGKQKNTQSTVNLKVVFLTRIEDIHAIYLCTSIPNIVIDTENK